MKTTKYNTGYRCDYKGVTIVAHTRVEATKIDELLPGFILEAT